MCSTANKLESVFCSNCGARLAPLTVAPPPEKTKPAAPPIKGLSLPAKPYDLTDQSVPTEEPPSSHAAESETPASNWIESIRSAAADNAPESTQDEDIPDWLRTAKDVSSSEPAPGKEASEWIQELEAEAEQTESVAADETGIPDWLQTESKAQVSGEPSAGVSAESPTERQPELKPDEPGWVKASIETTDSEAGQIPDWLKAPKPDVSQAQAAEPTEELTPGEPLIEALEAAAGAALPLVEGGMATPDWAQMPSSSDEEDLPDWLRETISASEESAAETTGPKIQPALPGQVPEWIAALKPLAEPAEVEAMETSGPLSGLRGVLPLALAMAEPHTAPSPPTPAPHPERAHLFDSILATPAVTPGPVAQRPRRVWTMRPLIYLLLLLAVLIPFSLPSDLASSSLKIANTPAAELYDTIERLPANSAVLLSFDYDPSQSGEMDLQARAIVGHLIHRRVKILAISTLDTGAPLAKRVLDGAARNEANYPYGGSYVNLGYLPGHESGLSMLATNGLSMFTRDWQGKAVSSLPVTANVRMLRDLQLVVLLAGSDDVLKAWMEQVQPRASIPIVAGVSAAVEPKARAYRDTPTKQLSAMSSGLIGAAQYEVLSNKPGLALISVNAQTAAQLLLVLVILIGNVVYWVRRPHQAQA